MPLALHEGGRKASADALGGKAVSATSLFLSLYMARNSSSQGFPVVNDLTALSTISSWEINDPTSSATTGYSRKPLAGVLGTTSLSNDGYASLSNTAAISWTNLTVARSIPGSDTNGILYAAISTQVTVNTTSPEHIYAIGPLQNGIFTWTNGDTLTINAGALEFRVS